MRSLFARALPAPALLLLLKLLFIIHRIIEYHPTIEVPYPLRRIPWDASLAESLTPWDASQSHWEP
jgi:hypothetical protein